MKQYEEDVDNNDGLKYCEQALQQQVQKINTLSTYTDFILKYKWVEFQFFILTSLAYCELYIRACLAN